MESIIKQVVSIRRYLHQNPELSGQEKETASYLKGILAKAGASEILENLGGNSFACLYRSASPGPVICFRADMDALPIREINSFEHKSTKPGISHKCGHDGHSAVLVGLGLWLTANPESYKGTIILLFQAAEETAAGALQVLSDPRFCALRPDMIFAMHNLPGFEESALILRNGTFASASCGIKIKLEGKSSHAGHPSRGNSPLAALMSLVQAFGLLPHTTVSFQNHAMVTIIHLRLGEEAFGTAPGDADLMATFRAGETRDLDNMLLRAEQLARDISISYGLKSSIEKVEYFDAVVNDQTAVDILRSASDKLKMKIVFPGQAFSWSEDFSFYGREFPIALFGLGAGLDVPELHNPDYDFPEPLFETSLKLYIQIIQEVVEKYAASQLD